MIDTPGHVDFTYEVSRSLAACEGAVLLVDAAQGIEAQTLANLYLALENDLHDHPGAQQDRPAGRRSPTGTPPRSRTSSAATPTTCCGSAPRPARASSELLDVICREVPAPVGDADAPARAMIFDSVYDIYRGVITYIRVVDGQFTPRERIKMMSTGADARAARDRRHLARADADRRAGRRRGRLPDHRREGRPPVARRRHRHRRSASRRRESARRLPRPAADGLLRAVSRSTARTTRCCATRSTSCGSTTPRWSTSRRSSRGARASASAAASSACCTWRSPATGSSASSTST